MCIHHCWTFISRETQNHSLCWRNFSQKGQDEPSICHKTTFQAANLALAKHSYISVGLWLNSISFHGLQTITVKQGKWCQAKSCDAFVSYGHSHVRSRPLTPNGLFRADWDITLLVIIMCSTSSLLSRSPLSLPPSLWSKIVHVTLSRMLKQKYVFLWFLFLWHCFIPPLVPSFSSNLMKS